MKRKQSPTLIITTCFCAGMMLVSGCTHPMAIKNLDSYRSYGITNLDAPLIIGIVADTTEPEQRRLLDGVAHALGGYSANVVMPYQPKSESRVDVVAHVDIQAEHEGSGWNFLVNWPGFLVWAPAWHGYMYTVKYTINCTLTEGGTAETIDQFKMPIALDVRHADMNRTWTEISWFEVSAIAFVGGLVFTSYDEKVTPLVSQKVENPLGKYIAQEIVKRINASGGFSYIHQKDRESGLAMLRPQRPRPQG